jgi:hypothetical protein
MSNFEASVVSSMGGGRRRGRRVGLRRTKRRIMYRPQRQGQHGGKFNFSKSFSKSAQTSSAIAKNNNTNIQATRNLQTGPTTTNTPITTTRPITAPTNTPITTTKPSSDTVTLLTKAQDQISSALLGLQKGGKTYGLATRKKNRTSRTSMKHYKRRSHRRR